MEWNKNPELLEFITWVAEKIGRDHSIELESAKRRVRRLLKKGMTIEQAMEKEGYTKHLLIKHYARKFGVSLKEARREIQRWEREGRTYKQMLQKITNALSKEFGYFDESYDPRESELQGAKI